MIKTMVFGLFLLAKCFHGRIKSYLKHHGGNMKLIEVYIHTLASYGRILHHLDFLRLHTHIICFYNQCGQLNWQIKLQLLLIKTNTFLLLHRVIQVLHTCRPQGALILVFVTRSCNWFWPSYCPHWLWEQMIGQPQKITIWP